MESITDLAQKRWSWFEIWQNAFLHPTTKTYSRILSDPKSSLQWGLTWAAVTSLVTWVLGLQREFMWGFIVNTFGRRETLLHFSILAAPIVIILGVLGFLFLSTIVHSLARLFHGTGTFTQLIFCWGVMQLPFILLAGLVTRIPFSFPPSREIGLIFEFSKLLIALCILLYLFYAQAVAFSAVEEFNIGKGFGIIILSAMSVGIIGTCLSYGFQMIIINSIRY